MASDPDDYLTAAGRPAVRVSGEPFDFAAAGLATGVARSWGDGLFKALGARVDPPRERFFESMGRYLSTERLKSIEKLAAINDMSAAKFSDHQDMIRHIVEANRPSQLLLDAVRQIERQETPCMTICVFTGSTGLRLDICSRCTRPSVTHLRVLHSRRNAAEDSQDATRPAAKSRSWPQARAATSMSSCTTIAGIPACSAPSSARLTELYLPARTPSPSSAESRAP